MDQYPPRPMPAPSAMIARKRSVFMVSTACAQPGRAYEIGVGTPEERPTAHFVALTITLPVTVSGSPCTFAENVTW